MNKEQNHTAGYKAMSSPKDSLFAKPDMVVSLLLPDLPSESVSYKYQKSIAREFVVKSKNPSEFASQVNDALGRETSKTRREALFEIRQRAIQVFALDEE
jgi:hypothetical protein